MEWKSKTKRKATAIKRDLQKKQKVVLVRLSHYRHWISTTLNTSVLGICNVDTSCPPAFISAFKIGFTSRGQITSIRTNT